MKTINKELLKETREDERRYCVEQLKCWYETTDIDYSITGYQLRSHLGSFGI